MRTTVNLDEHLLIAARLRAVEESFSLARVIEKALREVKRVKRGRTP